MIKAADITLAGKVNKTHGIGGELSISFFSQAIADSIEPGSCLIVDLDGIFTPFFTEQARPRSAEALLVKLDDVDTQEQAAQFVGKQVYMRNADIAQASSSDDEWDDEADGFYAGQLIGFTAIDGDTGETIGEITDIDEQTENVLFIIGRPDGTQVMIPVADELIAEIDPEGRSITFDLPVGLLDITTH